MKMAVKIDWREHGVGKDNIPVLDYRVPLAYEAGEYLYDIPAGAIRRKERNNDVPGLQYGLALGRSEENCAILVSDSKYGYRGAENTLALKLINSAVNPDPYPERGIHNITLWLGACPGDAKKAEELAMTCNHPLFYQPSNCHTGSLPMESSLLKVESETAVVSAVVPGEDGSILVRVYENAGREGQAVLTFAGPVSEAEAVTLSGECLPDQAQARGNQVVLKVEPCAIAAVRVRL